MKLLRSIINGALTFGRQFGTWEATPGTKSIQGTGNELQGSSSTWLGDKPPMHLSALPFDISPQIIYLLLEPRLLTLLTFSSPRLIIINGSMIIGRLDGEIPSPSIKPCRFLHLLLSSRFFGRLGIICFSLIGSTAAARNRLESSLERDGHLHSPHRT